MKPHRKSPQASAIISSSAKGRHSANYRSEKPSSISAIDLTTSEWFSANGEPSASDVEAYARIIAAHEGTALELCREQARLQLWASRPSRPRKLPLKRAHRILVNR
jgi:hypothetical protein